MAERPEQDSAAVRRVLAPNPGPMTLDGTNTWVIGDPRRTTPLVIDPGPLDEDHLHRVLTVAGGSISEIWLTHRHHDHSDGAARLGRLAGCRVRAADPVLASGPDDELIDGQQAVLDRVAISVVATPGHTSDSMSFLVHDPDRRPVLLTGDMVLGRGTTVITHPDGDLAAYLSSLESMIKVVDDHDVEAILPGHGDRVTDPAGVLRFYRSHRQERLAQVRAALAAGDRTAAEIVRRVYAGTDPAVWPAAEQSVSAQLDYLQQYG